MRLSLLATFVAAACVFSASAHADTITFTSAPGMAWSSAQSGSGTAVAYQNPGWAQPISGTQWISTTSSGGSAIQNEVISYTMSFTLLANQFYSGSLAFLADDSASIVINGNTVFTGGSYSGVTTVNLLSSYFRSGTNTLVIQDLNSGGGPAGVDFSGSITGAAVTPEPSSLVLFGTAVGIGVAWKRRRSLKDKASAWLQRSPLAGTFRLSDAL